ncbi:hypothetical protein HPB48_004645 [Haemaphysalis longicornis]|uniref:Uncharacterized protein n=1 Tax=Haemaphysalis longicornis TaxID=44386 RepID=A0A9J6FZH7_HAELO|nr:hypothetical protein HPB48_004645 [Haemaphysalis longicornis]
MPPTCVRVACRRLKATSPSPTGMPQLVLYFEDTWMQGNYDRDEATTTTTAMQLANGGQARKRQKKWEKKDEAIRELESRLSNGSLTLDTSCPPCSASAAYKRAGLNLSRAAAVSECSNWVQDDDGELESDDADDLMLRYSHLYDVTQVVLIALAAQQIL